MDLNLVIGVFFIGIIGLALLLFSEKIIGHYFNSILTDKIKNLFISKHDHKSADSPEIIVSIPDGPDKLTQDLESDSKTDNYETIVASKGSIAIGGDVKDSTVIVGDENKIVNKNQKIKETLNIGNSDLLIVDTIKNDLLIADTIKNAIIFADLEDHWKRLPKGKLLYNPPTEMKLGINERIEVRIAKDITECLTRGLKGKGEPHEEEIKVSPQMTVHLDGDEAFRIKRLFTKDSRAIIGDYTQWEWDVTPLKTGIQKLMLLVNAQIELPGYESKWIDFPVLEKEIIIKINYNYKIKLFWSTYWQWIIGTIIALLAAIIAWKKA